MRKNLKAVIASLAKGQTNRKAESIWTNGESVWSYGTCLAYRYNGVWWLNRTKYSVTTSIHQGPLKSVLSASPGSPFYVEGASSPDVREVDGLPRGDRLIDVARNGGAV